MDARVSPGYRRDEVVEKLIDQISLFLETHKPIPEEIIRAKNVKVGLRNEDGSGVLAGITTKGIVTGYRIEQDEADPDLKKKVPVEGKLTYCGYDVKEIVESLTREERFGFEEVVFLLLSGRLPEKSELKIFSKELVKRRRLTRAERTVVMEDVPDYNQMYVLHSAVSHLGRCDASSDSVEIIDVTKQCINLIAKIPNIIANAWNVVGFFSTGDLKIHRPRNELSTAENFLYMLNGVLPTKREALLFDKLLILHAEHGGGNNSTFTVRTVSSSGANTYMALASGVASLSGYLMGGADESVVDMIDELIFRGGSPSDSDIKEYLLSYIERKKSLRPSEMMGFEHVIPGFGHAVYTISDPRSVILREMASSYAEEKGLLTELDLYRRVEKIAVQLLSEMNSAPVCSNVDFYSGFLYRLLGIPKELFTPIFAMARMVGWSAHRIEQLIQAKIIRPAYISSSDSENEFVPMADRG